MPATAGGTPPSPPVPAAVPGAPGVAGVPGRAGFLPYSGALLPQEAYQLWKAMPGAQLVDVRTRAEWDWVGRIPDAVEIELLSLKH